MNLSEQFQDNEIKSLITLKNRIEKMTAQQHIELFRIIKTNNVDFNENKNGIFVNLSSIDYNIIKQLQEYVEYVEKQQYIINEGEKTKTEYIKEYFSNEDNAVAP
jgi:hypothetical protein